MSDPTTIKVTTNTTPNSCVDVRCDCNTMWSLVQQLSYQRLSVSTGELKGKLVQSYAVRARRISGTYARFYLEQEEGGDLSKKGRFYWMALGAFASKTVACTLEAWQVRMQAAAIDTTKEGLGKGNFWLFCDISAWHWYYSIYPRTFEKCLESRNAKNYVPTVKAQMAKLPWQAAALPKIKQMVVSEHIKTGFAKVKEFEESTNTIRARDAQLKHLLAIADHEQGVILQPLIYEDADFVFWLKLQRSAWVNWASPNLELAFSSACKTDDEKLKSVAPEGMKLEDLQNRMDWIGKAAKNFHRLMTTQKSYMESQLAIMASWHANLDE